jgi:hypothetical protein
MLQKNEPISAGILVFNHPAERREQPVRAAIQAIATPETEGE